MKLDLNSQQEDIKNAMEIIAGGYTISAIKPQYHKGIEEMRERLVKILTPSQIKHLWDVDRKFSGVGFMVESVVKILEMAEEGFIWSDWWKAYLNNGTFCVGATLHEGYWHPCEAKDSGNLEVCDDEQFINMLDAARRAKYYFN